MISCRLSFPRFTFRPVLLVGLVVSGAPALASDFVDPAGCFRAEDRQIIAGARFGHGGLTHTAGGDLVVYYEGDILLVGEDSGQILASFDPSIFGSFLARAPAGDEILFGESTEGKIYSIPIPEGEPSHIDTLYFNFDLVFDARGNGLVSAPDPGVGNRIYLLDRDPDALDPAVVVNIPGFSGPLALDDEGNLYYATSVFDRVPAIYRFTAAQVEAGVDGAAVDFADGEQIAEVESASGMVWAGGRLYYSDLGFGAAGMGRLMSLDGDAEFSPSVVAVFPPTLAGLRVSPGYLSLRPARRAFRCGAGPAGGAIAVAYSDFDSFAGISEIETPLYFVRGRINTDEIVDLSDAVALLGFLFLGGAPPDPRAAGDLNDDGELDVSDPIFLMSFLFLGGDEPPPPFRSPGVDPTP